MGFRKNTVTTHHTLLYSYILLSFISLLAGPYVCVARWLLIQKFQNRERGSGAVEFLGTGNYLNAFLHMPCVFVVRQRIKDIL